jgi:hypothetical protein
MPYCLDTSAWLDGWQRYYPLDVFPSLWGKLDEVVKAGEIVSSEEVYVELERKADDLYDWVKARKQMLVPLTEAVQANAAGLLSEYPRLVDTLRGRSMADPFVIATAMGIAGVVVVTGEIATGRLDKPRIPDVCGAKSIRCINFLEMIRELKLTF